MHLFCGLRLCGAYLSCEQTRKVIIMINANPEARAFRPGVSHSAATGAIATLATFLLCWALAALGIPLSHMLVALFTPEPMGSLQALASGAIWAFVSGGVIGAIIALSYNITRRFEPR